MYSSYSYAEQQFQTQMIFLTVFLILALIGSLVTYFLFLTKRNEGRLTGFLGWMYDFLNFSKLMVEAFIKILYMFFAIFITLYSIYMMFTVNFFGGLLALILANILIRILYEFSIIKIITCKNTSDINKKMTFLLKGEKSNAEPMAQTLVRRPQNLCEKCGTKLKPGAKFCPYCGAKNETR